MKISYKKKFLSFVLLATLVAPTTLADKSNESVEDQSLFNKLATILNLSGSSESNKSKESDEITSNQENPEIEREDFGFNEEVLDLELDRLQDRLDNTFLDKDIVKDHVVNFEIPGVNDAEAGIEERRNIGEKEVTEGDIRNHHGLGMAGDEITIGRSGVGSTGFIMNNGETIGSIRPDGNGGYDVTLSRSTSDGDYTRPLSQADKTAGKKGATEHRLKVTPKGEVQPSNPLAPTEDEEVAKKAAEEYKKQEEEKAKQAEERERKKREDACAGRHKAGTSAYNDCVNKTGGYADDDEPIEEENGGDCIQQDNCEEGSGGPKYLAGGQNTGNNGGNGVDDGSEGCDQRNENGCDEGFSLSNEPLVIGLDDGGQCDQRNNEDCTGAPQQEADRGDFRRNDIGPMPEDEF